MDNRRKVTVLFTGAALFVNANLVSDEEIDQIFNTKIKDIPRGLGNGTGELTGDSTIGDLVDKLMEDLDEMLGEKKEVEEL
jgi:hypothetical protein